MSSEFGLAVGESFAELLGIAAPSHVFRSRWYLPKKNLGDGLKEALRAAAEAGIATEGRLTVTSRVVERALNKGQGRDPALLVTTGFESWARAKQPFTTPSFSQTPSRRPLPVDADHVFGVGERVNADGTVVNALPLDEIEFLAAKLEMLKVKDVALGFMHAKKNPAHELAAAELLRAKGFRVFASHEIEAPGEAERWRLTLESSYAESAVADERVTLEAAATGLELSFWSDEGVRPWPEFSARTVRGGSRRAIKTRAAKGWTLHCGLDEFALYGDGAKPEHLGIQPTQLIRHGMWPFPHFADEVEGLEPGPMLFGRSQELAALDLFFARDRLREIEGFTPLLSERARPRILETLFTLGKSPTQSPGRRPPDALAIALDLERAFTERLNACLAFAGVKGELTLTGALAETLAPQLKERRPDIKIRLGDDAAWAEARAALAEENR